MQVDTHTEEHVQDEDMELAETMLRASQALDRLGLTAQDFLDELPAARAAVLQAAYGPAFLQQLERQFQAAHRASPVQQANEG